MRYISLAVLLPISILIPIFIPTFVFEASGIAVPDLAVGYNLQKSATLILDQPAPAEGLDIVLSRGEPSRLRISKRWYFCYIP